MSSGLWFERSALADRGYATLAAVDLGPDAASLHTASPGAAPPSVRPDALPSPSAAHVALAAVLRTHRSDALVLQGWPMRATSLVELAAPPVASPVRIAWAAALANAGPPAPAEEWPNAAITRVLEARLPALLAALWAPLATAPPPLRVLDCRPLGPHGRAAMVSEVFTVATSFAAGESHALLQIFHEAAHPVTDPAVFGRLGTASGTRDTRFGTAGFAAHRACEAAAVAWGTVILEGIAPDLLPAWAAWRARWGA